MSQTDDARETVYTSETGAHRASTSTDRAPSDSGSPPPPGPSGEADDKGTAATAKDKAADVASSAQDAGARVASTASEQASEVAGEAKAQLQSPASDARGQAQEQASKQKDAVTSKLRELAEELESLVHDGSSRSGMATDLVRQGSHHAHELAEWLEAREPGELIDEVRTLARRRPGAFLTGAAVAGMVAGRLTRGTIAATKADKDDHSG